MKAQYLPFILFICLFIMACQKDDDAPDCTSLATFGTTATCDGEVSFETDGNTFIADNFSSFATIDDFELGDQFRLSYIVTELAPPGLLCGPLVVADHVDITCFEDVE